MEPICFKVPRQKEETVRVENWNLPYFYEPMHFLNFTGMTLNQYRKTVFKATEYALSPA